MKKAILSSALLLVIGLSANANDEKPKKGFFKRVFSKECCTASEKCDPKDCPFDAKGNCVGEKDKGQKCEMPSKTNEESSPKTN